MEERAAAAEAFVTSIPGSPKDQLLFFIDNPIIAGEPGGQALIAAYKELISSLLGDGGGASGSASPFDSDRFASAPAEGASTGYSGGNGIHHGHDAAAGVALAYSLLGSVAGDFET